MGYFKSKLDIISHLDSIYELNDELVKHLCGIELIDSMLINIKSKSRAVIDDEILMRSVFEERELVYPNIDVNTDLSTTTAIKNLVFPQNAVDNDVNVPAKLLGYLNFKVDEQAEQDILSKIGRLNQLRATLKSELPLFESSRRKRAQLTRELTRNLLYQTIYRQIPIAESRTYQANFSWCRNQLAPVKQSFAYWESRISDMKTISEDTKSNWIMRLKEAKNIYRVGFVRPHITMTTTHIDTDGNSQRTTYKAHSPIIILSKMDTKIKVVGLDKLIAEKREVKREGLNQDKYRPIITGGKLNLVEIVQ